MNGKLKKYILIVFSIIIFALLLVFELGRENLFAKLEYGDAIYSILTRMIGGLVCLIFIYCYSIKEVLTPKTTLKKLIVFLPCMVIAVNNFPFVSYFSGDSFIDKNSTEIILYAITCISVGFFEEMAFRGCIFTVVVHSQENRRFGAIISIFISSAVFGLVHILNLFGGAGFIPVILQICYSFLIGGMCSVILLKTRNIWYCVFLHAVYNFAGGITSGDMWTPPQIVFTAVVAVIIAAYVIWTLVRITPKDISAFLRGEDSADT